MDKSRSGKGSACDTKKGFAMGTYTGTVTIAYTYKRGGRLLDKRARERFADLLQRLSRCEPFAWSYDGKRVVWRVTEIVVASPPSRRGFSISLERDDAGYAFVTSETLSGFEKKLRDLADASINFLPFPNEVETKRVSFNLAS